MELKDLKSAWDKFSSNDASKHQLGEEVIYEMLKKRTRNFIERIDRNIRIGVGVLILLALFFAFDDVLLSSEMSYQATPLWVQLMEGAGILFIVGSFVYFLISYRLATKDYSHSNDLSKVLTSIIRILNVYRKLFYMALGILLLILSISFISGMFMGVELKADELGTNVDALSTAPPMIRMIVIGVVVLLLVISGLFFLFRWGFRKLYGNYIFKLKATLMELDEIE